MLMKVFKHGIGRGEKVIGYVTNSKVEKRKHNPPKILRGDPEQVKKLIDTTSRKWRYTSGVLSWAPEDKVTPEQEQKLMDSFERHAFAGLEPDQYSILWVRHSHAGHHELHFVIPRTELRTDKALNPCPPGWDKQYNPWCELWNRKNNWARPDELKRARIVSPGASINSYQNSTASEIRTSVTQSILQGVEAGLIKDRADIVSTLEKVGFSVPRQGKNYITIEIPSEDSDTSQKKQRIRLKGTLYAESWSAAQQISELSQSPQRANGSRDAAVERDNREHIIKLEQRVATIREKRAAFHAARFANSDSRVQRAPAIDLQATQNKSQTSHPHIGSSHHTDMPFDNSWHNVVDKNRTGRTHHASPDEQRAKRNQKNYEQLGHLDSNLRREPLHNISTGNKAARARNNERESSPPNRGVKNDRNSDRDHERDPANRNKTAQATQRSFQPNNAHGKRAQQLQASTDSLGRRFARSCRAFRKLVGTFRQVQKVKKKWFDLQR